MQDGVLDDFQIAKLPMGQETESGKSIGIFVANIITMVINMFILFGICMISLIIWAVGDDDEL